MNELLGHSITERRVRPICVVIKTPCLDDLAGFCGRPERMLAAGIRLGTRRYGLDERVRFAEASSKYVLQPTYERNQ